MKTEQMAHGWRGGSLGSLWRDVGEDEGKEEGTLALLLEDEGIH